MDLLEAGIEYHEDNHSWMDIITVIIDKKNFGFEKLFFMIRSYVHKVI